MCQSSSLQEWKVQFYSFNEPFLDTTGPFRFYIAQEEIPPHLVATDMIVRIPQGAPWPSVALAPPGRYDALKFMDDADTRESVHQNWDDDVFEVSS